MSAPTQPRSRHRIDLTMMLAVHDAFRRDLTLLTSAADDDVTAFAAGWRTFKNFLGCHHMAEDVAVWPLMRAKLADDPVKSAVLDDMEAEHAELDPRFDRIDALLAAGEHGRLREHMEDLSRVLLAHLDHEETVALPLVQQTLTPKEWDGFGEEQRRRVGVRNASTFFPWLLDGAPEATQREVLGVLPPPLRLLHRYVWRPPYERRSPWRRLAD